MNLEEFKKVEDVVKNRCNILNGSYQLFIEPKGISKNRLTIFENELVVPNGVKYDSFIIFTEIHGNMYFGIVKLEDIVWLKVKNYKNRNFIFEINMINSVEVFLGIKAEIKKEEDSEIRPSYYKPNSAYEPRKIINHYKLSFNLGNVIKYTLRAGEKNKATLVEDLKKAITYLQFEIEDNNN